MKEIARSVLTAPSGEWELGIPLFLGDARGNCAPKTWNLIAGPGFQNAPFHQSRLASRAP